MIIIYIIANCSFSFNLIYVPTVADLEEVPPYPKKKNVVNIYMIFSLISYKICRPRCKYGPVYQISSFY